MTRDSIWIPCGRLMVGSGGDTYDPVCELREKHKSMCRSTSAIDQHRLTDAGLVALSLEREKVTGEDSILTIERAYFRTDSGAYLCPWPECPTVRRDPVKMWRHVHSAAPHHTSYRGERP
jgi:hypothetical protein